MFKKLCLSCWVGFWICLWNSSRDLSRNPAIKKETDWILTNISKDWTNDLKFDMSVQVLISWLMLPTFGFMYGYPLFILPFWSSKMLFYEIWCPFCSFMFYYSLLFHFVSLGNEHSLIQCCACAKVVMLIITILIKFVLFACKFDVISNSSGWCVLIVTYILGSIYFDAYLNRCL